jgi:hypothetical protein
MRLAPLVPFQLSPELPVTNSGHNVNSGRSGAMKTANKDTDNFLVTVVDP